LPHCDDPLAFLMAVMANPDIDARLRIDAAKALMPYVHPKLADAGVKDEKQAAAKKVASGKFGASAPPLRAVK